MSKAFPGFGQAILLIIALVFLQVILTIPFVLLGIFRHPAALALPTLIGTTVAIVYAYSKNFSKTGDRFREVFPFRGIPAPTLFFLLLSVVGLLIVNLELVRVVQRIIPPPRILSELLRGTVRLGQPWMLIATVAVLSPLSEECLFRGVILHAFLCRYNPGKAVILSALLFAVTHGNPWQFVTGFCFGVFLAWCFVRTGSLVPCFFAHIMNNLIALLLPVFQRSMPFLSAWTTNHSRGVIAFGFIALVFGIYLMHLSSPVRPAVGAPIQPETSESTKEREC